MSTIVSEIRCSNGNPPMVTFSGSLRQNSVFAEDELDALIEAIRQTLRRITCESTLGKQVDLGPTWHNSPG